MDIERVVDTLQETGQLAAHLCLNMRSKLVATFMTKPDQDPVTLADFSLQALILHNLHLQFPTYGVLAEETLASFDALTTLAQKSQVAQYVGDILHQKVTIEQIRSWFTIKPLTTTPYVWLIDPLDGTRGFFQGDQFTIAIALLHHGQPIIAMLVCPLMPFDYNHLGVIAQAVHNQGAVARSLVGNMQRIMSVSKQTEEQLIRIAVGNIRQRDRMVAEHIVAEQKIRGHIVEISSQAKYVALADGQIEAFFRYASATDHAEKSWDHAAGALIVHEAGGCVTDLDTTPLDFKVGTELVGNRGILATNKTLHDAFVTLLATPNHF